MYNVHSARGQENVRNRTQIKLYARGGGGWDPQVEKTADKLSVSRSGARRSYRPNRRLTRCGSAAAVLSG